MSRVLEFIQKTPWAIVPEALETILEIASREHQITPEALAGLEAQAIERVRGQRIEGTQKARMRDGGIAVLPVHGPIFRYANLFTAISGATSTETLANDFATLMADPKVRQIVLEVDSPGGMVNGTGDLSTLIRESRGGKPITAFISGMGASAAYYIASAADRVLASQSAIVGAIGTVLEVTDYRQADAKRGIQSLEFVSAQSPRKRMDPFSEDEIQRNEARASLQKLVDDLAQVFVEDVATNRGVSIETVLSDYGQGGVLIGSEALDAGLVDGIATLEDFIAQTQEGGGRRGGGARMDTAAARTPGSTREKEVGMADTPKAAGGGEQPVIDRVYLDAEKPELVSALKAEGAAEERERIIAIQALDGPDEVIQACVEDATISAGDAALKILEAQREREKARADAHLKTRAESEEGLDAPEPSVPTGSAATDDRARAKRAVALHRQLRGTAAPASA